MTAPKDQIRIFDTTLRDGEQSPGCSMNLEEKLKIAAVLEDLKVDIIEAGFPIASKGDFEAVQAIARQNKNSTITGLCRAVEKDIDCAWDALKDAQSARIHTFISTSPLHRKYKLRMSEEQVLEAITKSVSYARNKCDDIEWSCEDGSRTEHDFLCRSIETAIHAGATTINIPDTVGYATPEEYAALFTTVLNRVPNIDKAVLSAHCHNDLGLAVANSIASIEVGVRQVECTINGIGERAGNAALEEIVMALRVRGDLYPYDTAIDSTQITKASRLLSSITGFAVQPNKAIVGANAFAHESGIHQDGYLKNAQTYEIMLPETVGLSHSNIVLGKHSGRHALRKKLEELGLPEVSDETFLEIFSRFKDLADHKKEIFEEDLIALVDDAVIRVNDLIQVKSLHVICGSTGLQFADLVLEIENEEKRTQAVGNGPVDAVFAAIRKLVPSDKSSLKLYQVHAVTGGTDAQAEVTVRLEEENRLVVGQGADHDTLVASARAYVNALNKLFVKRGRSALDGI